jgi:hypothetical protein
MNMENRLTPLYDRLAIIESLIDVMSLQSLHKIQDMFDQWEQKPCQGQDIEAILSTATAQITAMERILMSEKTTLL